VCVRCFACPYLEVFWALLSDLNKQTNKQTAVTVQHTREACVSNFEVRLEIFGTRLWLCKERVWNGNLARLASRAASVGQFGDVRRAPDVSVVDLGTATELHPAVQRMRHQYDVTGFVASRVEGLRLTVSLVFIALTLTSGNVVDVIYSMNPPTPVWEQECVM